MVNHMILQGRLVADPELRSTTSGVAVCSFRVAWSEKYKDNETKLFLACTAWRSTGEMVSKYFSKGQEIVVEGKLNTRDWTDREGNSRQTVEMTVDRVHFCGPKSGDGSNSSQSYSAPAKQEDGFSELTDDDGKLQF